MKKGMAYSPDKDAGWGLIYRLNDLWVKADVKALAGDLESWDFVLDRIFCNLAYQEELEIEGEDKIIEIKLGEKDKKEYNWFKNKIREIKQKMREALKLNDEDKKKKEYSKEKQNHYDVLMLKDIWLRKLMFKLELYLKTYDKEDPSQVLFGARR